MIQEKRTFRPLQFTQSSSSRRAMTLLELLVVIAMIGILMAMLIPSLKKSMRRAASTLCMTNLREIGNALHMYHDENNGWLPIVPLTNTAAGTIAQADEQARVWFQRLFPTYLNDPAILACPDDPFKLRMQKVKNIDDPAVTDYASYGINNFVTTAGGGFLADIERHRPPRPLDTILLADLGPDTISRLSPTGQAGPARNKSQITWDDGFDPFGIQTNPDPWLTVRHGDGINVLTMGFSVRQAKTLDKMRVPLTWQYRDCKASGCTLCNELFLYHYSFARERLFWWTGPAPTPPNPES